MLYNKVPSVPQNYGSLPNGGSVCRILEVAYNKKIK